MNRKLKGLLVLTVLFISPLFMKDTLGRLLTPEEEERELMQYRSVLFPAKQQLREYQKKLFKVRRETLIRLAKQGR